MMDRLEVMGTTCQIGIFILTDKHFREYGANAVR